MRDCGLDRTRSSDGFSYLVIAGVNERDGLLPVVKRRYRVVAFSDKKDADSVIQYVVDQGWFPRDTKWIEVYRVLPVAECKKDHRRFDLSTLFKGLDNENRVRKKVG
jgi:hypothetical protein